MFTKSLEVWFPMKENQRVAVTKRMLKEGLLRLLEEKPLEKIRVNELCSESGINRATFYRHYETPHDVLAELELDIAGEILANISRQQPKTMQEAQNILKVLCTHIYNHADIFKVLFQCNTDEDMRRKLTIFYSRIWELRIIDERKFANMDEETVMMINTMLGGGCYCLLRYWIMCDVQKTPEEIAAIMCNVVRWPMPGDFGT